MHRLSLAVWLAFTALTAAAEEPLLFEEHIRPILKAHCLDCHGATEELEGSLDLRLVRLMQTGGDSGPALVAGDAAGSLILARIRSGEMPPGDAKMPAEETELLARWIASGAATKRPEPTSIGPGLGISPEERAFWAFQPIERPEVPAGGDAASPIDRLLSAASGEPSAELPSPADRRTLVQRATSRSCRSFAMRSRSSDVPTFSSWSVV